MLYFILYVQNENGNIDEIKFKALDILKKNLKEIYDEYKNKYNIIRSEIAFIISNKKFFRLVISNFIELENIKLFMSYGASGSGSSDAIPPMSIGFIDLNKKIRYEYFNGEIRIYYTK